MVIAESNIRLERFSFTSFGGEPASTPVPKNPATKNPAGKSAASASAEEVPTEIIEVAPPAPVFSEADLEAARAESYKKGFSEGEESAETEQKKEAATREEALRSLLEVIANRITLAAEDHGKQLETQRASLCTLALAIARKVADVALKNDVYAPLEALLHECSALAISEPVLTLVVSPEFAEPLVGQLDTLRTFLTGFEGKIEVKSDPELHEYDCRVEWQRGFMERNTERLWEDIEKLLIPTPTAAEG